MSHRPTTSLPLRHFLKNRTAHSLTLCVVGALVVLAHPLPWTALNVGVSAALLATVFWRVSSSEDRWFSTQGLYTLASIPFAIIKSSGDIVLYPAILGVWAMGSGVLGLVWSDRNG
jgi:hypothetical protein